MLPFTDPKRQYAGKVMAVTSLTVCQLPTIPPQRTRIEPPRSTVFPSEDIMDHIRHEERHRREIVNAAFEAPVSGPEDQWCDALLERRQRRTIMFDASRGLTLSVAINDFSNRRYA